MNLKKYLVIVSSFIVAATVHAAPPSKQTAPSPSQTLRSPAEFQQLKSGDKLAMVCKECDTVSVETVASQEQVMQHCTEGAQITCPSCKTVAKVVKHGPSGKEGTHSTTKIVNEKGEECMFFAKLPN